MASRFCPNQPSPTSPTGRRGLARAADFLPFNFLALLVGSNEFREFVQIGPETHCITLTTVL